MVCQRSTSCEASALTQGTRENDPSDKIHEDKCIKVPGEGKVQFFGKELQKEFPWDQLLKKELGMPDTFPVWEGHSQEKLITQIYTYWKAAREICISQYFSPQAPDLSAVLLLCCAQIRSPGCCWSQRRVVSRPSQGARFDTESTNMEKPIFCASHNHLLLCTARQNVTFHQSSIVAFFSLLLIMESFRKQRTGAAGCQYTINLFSFIPSSFINTTEEKQSAQCWAKCFTLWRQRRYFFLKSWCFRAHNSSQMSPRPLGHKPPTRNKHR